MGLGAPALNTNQKREPPNGPPFVPTSADNGLSVDPVTGHIVLGQDFGDPGNPAAVLTPREIPENPGAFIEIRNSLFSTGGLSVVGISNNLGISGLPFALSISMEDDQGSGINIVNTAAGVFGARIQMTSDVGTASGLVGVWGRHPTIPAGQRDFTFLATNNNANGGIALITNARNAPTPGYFSFWGTDGVGTAQEYYRFIPPVSAVLDFLNTAPQTSSDLTVAVPGARSGDAVQVGVPTGSVNANTCYTGFVSANDVVTIRFNNYSAAAVDPASGTFKVGVMRVLP